MIDKSSFCIRLLIVLVALLTPYICLLGYGYLSSLSMYWKTEMQPLFIISNTMTAYYFYSMTSWKMSSIFLLLLTAFSIDTYIIVHNIFAIIFFIVNLYPLILTNHFKWCKWIYLSSIIAFPFSTLLAEIIAINALCLYAGLLLFARYKVSKQKLIIRDNI